MIRDVIAWFGDSDHWHGANGVPTLLGQHALLTLVSMLLAGAAGLPLALWLGHGGLEKAMLVGSLLLVPAAELLNSAVEAVVDKVSPEFHELAGRAKDMGSAAVFVLMLNAVLCWVLVLGPRLFA